MQVSYGVVENLFLEIGPEVKTPRHWKEFMILSLMEISIISCDTSEQSNTWLIIFFFLSPCHLVLIYFVIESCVTFTWLVWHSFIVQTFSLKSFETLWTNCRLTIHCKHLLFYHEIAVHRQCKMLKTTPFCIVSNRTCDLKSYFSAATKYVLLAPTVFLGCTLSKKNTRIDLQCFMNCINPYYLCT